MFIFGENEGQSLYSRLREDTFGPVDHPRIELLSPFLRQRSLVPLDHEELLSPFRPTELSFPPRETEIEILKEIKSKNENFMQEKNIKYNLYPLI